MAEAGINHEPVIQEDGDEYQDDLVVEEPIISKTRVGSNLQSEMDSFFKTDASETDTTVSTSTSITTTTTVIPADEFQDVEIPKLDLPHSSDDERSVGSRSPQPQRKDSYDENALEVSEEAVVPRMAARGCDEDADISSSPPEVADELTVAVTDEQRTRQVLSIEPDMEVTSEFHVRPHMVAADALGHSVQQLEWALQQEIDKSTKTEETEVSDEITVETRVTEVKTLKMEMGPSGSVSVSETTEVHTDTELQEHKVTKEKEELVVTHKTDRKAVEDHSRSPTMSPAPPYSPRNKHERSFERPPSRHSLPRDSDLEQSFTNGSLLDIQHIDSTPLYFVAISPYEPESDEVMSLHEGEQVEILDDAQEDWWLVRKRWNNAEGWVPGQYLQEKGDYDDVIDQRLMDLMKNLPSEPSKDLA